MKYKNINDLSQRCSEHPAHQNGMVSHQMIQDRLFEEIQELREYITQRPWVGLTPEEVLDLFDINNVYGSKWIEFARTVEAALRSKNT